MISLVDALDRFVAVAESLGGGPEVAAAADLAQRAREGFGGETLVAALVGGTGSGKSAIINALAGSEVVASGAMRPTTTRPVVLVPAEPEPGLVAHLAAVGIVDVVTTPGLDRLALVDLPDTDSVNEENRRRVDLLLPLVDVVVWVLDPEKYHDRAVHAELIRPAVAHAARFVFVLNQLDRVPSPVRTVIVSHLHDILVTDGVDDPVIIAMAADPPLGPPEGVEDLAVALGDLGTAKDVVAAKLLTDVSLAVSRVRAEVDAGAGTGCSPPGGGGNTEDRAGRTNAAQGHRWGRRPGSVIGALGIASVGCWLLLTGELLPGAVTLLLVLAFVIVRRRAGVDARPPSEGDSDAAVGTRSTGDDIAGGGEGDRRRAELAAAALEVELAMAAARRELSR